MTYETTPPQGAYKTTDHAPQSTTGALTEIIGLVVVAVVAMGLLTFGYSASNNISQTTQTQLPTPAAASQQMSDPALPRASGANTPAAPTTSTSGQGPSSGR